MRAINHALTGAVIGLSVSNPVVALPLALASHFICDAIPHYGEALNADDAIRTRSFASLLTLDALLCVGLVLLLGVTQPHNWLVAALGAFLATLPDFASMPGYLRVRRGGTFVTSNTNAFVRFAKKIQWFERPIGAFVEIAWFTAGVIILITYL